MKAKKWIGMALSAVMLIGTLAGCASDTTSTNNNAAANKNKTEVQESQDDSVQTNDVETGNGKILVAYYSATGSTKAVAETIAETTGADLFEITPKDPYSDDDLDWTNDDSRVSKEHVDESLRDVELASTTPENWDSYDTVLIGYPIWWGIAAWPVDHFVTDNDFSGKTVIPFCTSASSGIGDSGNLLEKMGGTGDWQEGQRFSSGASASDVNAWVESLGL